MSDPMSDKGPDSVHLTVVFPAYNAERHIAASLEKAAAYLGGQPFASEIIVVSSQTA